MVADRRVGDIRMKISIVTGASSGMGREFVKQMSAKKEVDEIWAVARRKDRLEQLAAELETPVRAIACDLTNGDDINALRAKLEEEKPDVYMLVNCAGFAKFGNFGDISPEDEINMIDLDVRALVLMTQMVVPYMNQGGHIVQIASTAAFQPLPQMNVYAASKAFVYSYSRALNKELEIKGIGVTTACPGWTKTEFFDVAEKNAKADAVHTFSFMAKPENVVKKALHDAEKNREMSVYGLFNKVHLFFSKILPDSAIMGVWRLLK